MSKYRKFIKHTEKENRVSFQEWFGHNIIFNGSIDKTTGKGIGRFFRLEEEIELDIEDTDDAINLIAKQYIE